MKEPVSGRVLKIETNQPGMVMYTSNNLADNLTLAEGRSRNYLGICFETQGSPASLQYDRFPSIVLNKGDTYKKQTVFTFTTEN